MPTEEEEEEEVYGLFPLRLARIGRYM